MITVACEPDSSGQVSVLQKRYEVVIYDKGINVWEHFLQDSKIEYRGILFFQHQLTARKKYRLEVGVNVPEKTLMIQLEGHCMTLYAPLIPDKFYIGIMSCKGVNRFYDFEVINYE